MNTETKKKRKKSRSRSGRGPRYWVIAITTMGALVAYTVGNSRAVALAHTRDIRSERTATHSSGQTQTQQIRFDISPDSLDVVLNAFQKATGLQVLVTNEAIRNIQSPGVSGVYTIEQALQQLLTGTGVSYSFTALKTVTLEIQARPESVEVRDEAERVSSPKYTEPLRDTPQTITVIPREVIEKQGATTLRDVLRNVPGLTITAGEGGVPAGDNLTLRGFSARNDVFIDGVRDLSPQSRDPFNIEQVEVVKGPGSAFTGRGSSGGTINLASKLPTLRRSFGGTLNLGTDKTKRATADINLPLNDRIAFRLNLVAHDAEVAGRDVVENERWGLAPSIAFGLGTPTRYTFSYFKLKQNNISDYGIPWVPATNNALAAFRDRPAPVPRNTFYGFKNRDFEKLDADLVTFKFEHDFNDNLSLRNQLRYGYSTRDSIATPPRFANNNSTVINRELRSWLTEDRIWDNQSDLNAKFFTGKVGHTLVGGLNLTHENNTRVTRTAGNTPTTLLNPNPNDVFTGTITTGPFVGDVTGKSLALYLFDTAKLSKEWEITGGLRWDYFDVSGVDTANAPVSRIDRMLSGRIGVVYKPAEHGSIYASYGTSLNPSLEGLSYSVANVRIDPEKTRTYEVGSKWDLLGARLLVSGALFRVEKTNARTPGLLPGDPPQVLDGEQRVDGIEFSATGNISRNWMVLAAYTLLDSEVVDSNTPAEVGKRLINTPRNSINLWTTYRIRKLELGGGARFTDRRFGNNTNTRVVGRYWLVDAMASYPLSEHIDLRLNLYNLTDEYYFDRLGGGHIVPGPGRSALLSTSFRF
jgi:catecholate siderophore receptor